MASVECAKEVLGAPYGQQILADDYDMSRNTRRADMEFVAAAPEDIKALLAYIAYLKPPSGSRGCWRSCHRP